MAGLRLAKATVVFFEDLAELEHKILGMKPCLASYSHRYIVAEGLFACDGTICDLPGLVILKEKHGMKLIVDETLSLGSVGVHGVVDYFNNRITDEPTKWKYSLRDLDIILGSLELTVGSIGGFCCTNQVGIKKLQ